MGFFDHLQSKGIGAIQPQRAQIRRVEQKTVKPTIQKSPSVPAKLSSASKQHPPQRAQTAVKRTASSATAGSSASNDRDRKAGSPRRYKSESSTRKKPSPLQRLSSSDDDGDSGDEGFLDLRIPKRVKVSASAEPDLKRHVRDVDAFSAELDESLDLIHAADITGKGNKPTEFTAAFGAEGEPANISLRYPGATQGERYQLVVPHENDGFKPLDDIVNVVDTIASNYIAEEHREIFDDETTGIKRRFRRALAHSSLDKFQNAVNYYNNTIEKLRKDESVQKHLDMTHSLSLPLIERILTQVYARTVSPRVDSLRQYENGSDNVYGELLPRFISDIFKQTKLKSDQVFVDLGSGVGNVTLQAALEVGCESWGCEVMQNAAELAQLQRAEFKSRCRIWGIAPGKVHLIRGDFLEEKSIGKALRKADVVLVNNQAFTPQLNNELINHFLDLKEGCQIVSLKSFVPAGHKIQSRNLNSPVNLLSVEKKNYWSDCVSWTNAGGTYFIATKDSSRLKTFLDGA